MIRRPSLLSSTLFKQFPRLLPSRPPPPSLPLKSFSTIIISNKSLTKHNFHHRRRFSSQSSQTSSSFVTSSLITKLLQFASLFYVTFEYIIEVTMLLGPSMLPTFKFGNDVVLVDLWSCKLFGLDGGLNANGRILDGRREARQTSNVEDKSTFLRPLKKGDIIIAYSLSRSNGTSVCKRIIALPGDTVTVANSFLTERLGGTIDGYDNTKRHMTNFSLNNHRSDKEIAPGFTKIKRTITVPDGHVWVEGDNSVNSVDSRDYGPIPLALVRGRVVVCASGSDGIRLVDHGMAFKPVDGEEGRMSSCVCDAGSDKQVKVIKRREILKTKRDDFDNEGRTKFS